MRKVVYFRLAWYGTCYTPNCSDFGAFPQSENPFWIGATVAELWSFHYIQVWQYLVTVTLFFVNNHHVAHSALLSPTSHHLWNFSSHLWDPFWPCTTSFCLLIPANWSVTGFTVSDTFGQCWLWVSWKLGCCWYVIAFLDVFSPELTSGKSPNPLVSGQ